MDEDRDLLPWVLGTLSIAAVAVGIAAVSSNGVARRVLPTHDRTTNRVLPVISPNPPVPSPAPTPRVSAPTPPVPAPTQAVPALRTLAVPQMQVAASAMEPGGKVWECSVNGQRSFSDYPCGDKAIVREIGPINRMDSTPVSALTRSYESEPSHQPEYFYPSADESEQASGSEQQPSDGSYPVYVGIPFRRHARPNHAHRPRHDGGPRARMK